MAALFATMAFHWAGRRSLFPAQLAGGVEPHRTQKLYYGTAQFTIPRREPVSLAPITLSIDIAPYLNTKLAAFKAHQTQAPLFPIFEQNVLRQGGKEHFHLAATTTPRIAQPEADPFEGVTE
jgi:LmbE family N-acetylglucosaminyl deacetylase